MLTWKYKYLARFGLMHMVATNLAVWFAEVVTETLRDIRHEDKHPMRNTSTQDAVSGNHIQRFEQVLLRVCGRVLCVSSCY